MKKMSRMVKWETQQRFLEFYSAVVHPRGKSYFSYRRGQLGSSSKHTDPTKLIDRLLRYQKCLGKEIPFKGLTVLEIGAGPVLGWAFCALALRAKRYYVLDPAFDAKLLADLTGYLKEHHRYVSRVFGPVGTLDDVVSSGEVKIIRRDASDTGLPDGAVDLILSNSVLEHVHNLDDVVRELHRVSHPACIQFHFVDLTDHYKTDDPFSRLYPFHPNYLRRLFARRGLSINMLRAPDLNTIFSRYFRVRQTVFMENCSYDSIREAHGWWKKRYSAEELGVEVVGIEAIAE